MSKKEFRRSLTAKGTRTPVDAQTVFDDLLKFAKAATGTDEAVWQIWQRATYDRATDREIAWRALVCCQVLALRVADLEKDVAQLAGTPDISTALRSIALKQTGGHFQ